jgi:hypothetical protein
VTIASRDHYVSRASRSVFQFNPYNDRLSASGAPERLSGAFKRGRRNIADPFCAGDALWFFVPMLLMIVGKRVAASRATLLA